MPGVATTNEGGTKDRNTAPSVAPSTSMNRRLGIWFPIGIVALFLATILYLYPGDYFSHREGDLVSRRADAGRLLPLVVTWWLTGTVLSVSLLLAACWSVVIMYLALAGRPLARVLVPACFGLLAIGYVVMDIVLSNGGAREFSNIFPLLGDGGDPRPAPQLQGIYARAHQLGGLGGAVSIVVLGAAWVLSSGTRNLGVVDLFWRRESLMTLLGLASAGLASGSIATSTLLRLNIDPAIGKTGIEHAQAIAGAATVGYGGVFSIVLLVIFIPAAWVLRAACASLASEENPGTSEQVRQKWLVEHGLVIGIPARLISALAALAPLLSSAFSSSIAAAFAKAVG